MTSRVLMFKTPKHGMSKSLEIKDSIMQCFFFSRAQNSGTFCSRGNGGTLDHKPGREEWSRALITPATVT